MTSIFFFFFSSRRGHTRLQGDWSSDVCSSDLPEPLSTSMPASSQKPARRPPPSSSVPRKPMRLMLAPPVDRPVLEGPEPFRCVTPTSTTPKISTLDCAEAAPGKDARQASATPSMGVWMVFMGLSPLGWWLGGGLGVVGCCLAGLIACSDIQDQSLALAAGNADHHHFVAGLFLGAEHRVAVVWNAFEIGRAHV